MPYLDESGLKTLSRNIVNAIKENTQEKETIFGNGYCVEACRNYLNSTYTADTFPLRYHINKGNEIWIDGISEAGLSDNNFSKENITINSKYTIDGTEYTVTGVGDYGLAVADEETLKSANLTDDSVKKFSKSNDENDALFCCSSITLPLTVTHLGSNAFADIVSTRTSNHKTKRLLQYVQGMDNVVEVSGSDTFNFCSRLKTVYFPRLNNIVKNMFQACTDLTDVCLGDVSEIPESAFRRCYRLTDITKFNNSAFEITSIGDRAFEKSLALKNFNFDVTKVTSVGENAFWFSPYETDWQAMMNNGCTFGLRATKYQLWDNQEALTHKFNFTPCLNTNGKNYSFQQSYNGWRDITIGNSTNIYYGANGCTWTTVTMAHNILSGQNLTPVQFNNLVANSKDSEKANAQLSGNNSAVNDVSIGSIIQSPAETFQSIESIQGIYDGLAAGNIYNVGLITAFEPNSWRVAGAHSMLLVGVDERGFWICCESNYAGPNLNEPVSGLIHFDLFTWLTDKSYENGSRERVERLTYNPHYVMKG